MPSSLAVALGALLLAYLGWLAIEWRLAVGEIVKGSTQTDRGTCELYAFGRAATVLSALALPIQWNSVGIWYPIGCTIFLAGVFLRLSAIHYLGAYYSHRVRLRESHRIVSDGPYRVLRHPAYSGMILAHCGFVVCFFNVTSAAILLIILAPAVILRIRVEERVLFELDGYREYARNRARLIPLLW
jgi:protein-S-isoprenylcysteine O-methyltransferase Ste14